jgi:ATP-dependent helicase/DNAse subunit B
MSQQQRRKMVKRNYAMEEEKKTEDAHESPLREESSSSSSTLKNGELFLDTSESSSTSNYEVIEVNPPLMAQRRNVSFTGIGDSPTSAMNIPKGASREESDREIKRLREKVAEVKIDYQAEKATRKRKEKNLVKLAKELSKRTAEIDFKDSQIKRVSNFLFSSIRSCVLACIRGDHPHCEFTQ